MLPDASFDLLQQSDLITLGVRVAFQPEVLDEATVV